VINSILDKLNELEGLYKKVNLLIRKKDRMGLTDEELEKLILLEEEYYDKFSYTINDLIKNIVDMIIGEKGKKSLKEIQKLVKWNGDNVLKFDDFEALLIESENLTEREVKKIEKNLIILHEDVFMGFEKFCEQKNILMVLDEMGKSISMDEQGGIKDVIKYIDNMYRDFADIFEINLPKVELFLY
jgi:uncharacterized protein YnzC (UPF0291/DUF896 family)